MLAFALIPIFSALRFRPTFTATEFDYRRRGSTIWVPHADIQRIEVTDVTPVGKQAVGAFVVTKRGARLSFWQSCS